VAGAVRTDVPANIPEPATLPNPVVAGLNPNQLALVGFSRYLETKTMAMAEKQGPAAANAMTMEIGQRVLWSSAKDRHGEVAVQRVDRFFELARQGRPGPAGAGRAKKAPVKAAVKAAAAKKAQAVKGAAKKASKVAAKKETIAKKKSSSAKKTMNPLLKVGAKEIARRAGKAVAKKALVKAIKKSGQKRAR
jgi:hypothetical protein